MMSLSQDFQDLSLMEKSEVSKNLFTQIQWEEIMRSGVFLSHQDHQLLERAQSNLSVIMDNKQDSVAVSKMLITIAENCTQNLTVQQYVFTRIEEILGLVNDSNDIDNEVFGSRHAPLFTKDGVHVIDGPFLKAISSSDIYLQQSASKSLACLFTVCKGDIGMIQLVTWINTKLKICSTLALPAITILSRNQDARRIFVESSGVHDVVEYLLKLGTNGNAQTIYELSFILWSMSMDIASTHNETVNSKGESTSFSTLMAYLHAGAIPCLVDLISAAPSRKVVRMSIGTLKNLAITENDNSLTELLSGSLPKLLDNIVQSNAHKQANDPEFENDVKVLYEIMNRNYRDLSTFERWESQVHAGALRWGIVHTEKFWRENAKFAEANDFKIIKELIALMKSDDPMIVCIALYDMGEFTRFYPNGRGIVKSLGGKDLALQMISSDNPTIQSHALRCVSKVMVNNWEFLR